MNVVLQFLLAADVVHAHLLPQIPLRPAKSEAIQTPDDSWTLRAEEYQPNSYQSAPFVANGYFGQSLPAEGVGHWLYKTNDSKQPEPNVWPLKEPRQTFGTISGFWNLQDELAWPPGLPENMTRGGNSVIAGIPNWTGLFVSTEDGNTFAPGVDASVVTRYSRSWSLRNGIVQTNVTWKPTASQEVLLGNTLQLNYTVLAHRQRLNLALVRLEISVSTEEFTRLVVSEIVDGSGAVRAEAVVEDFASTNQDPVCMGVRPAGISSSHAYICSDVHFEYPAKLIHGIDTVQDIMNMTSVRRWRVEISQKYPLSVLKYVGIAHSDTPPVKGRARHHASKVLHQAKQVGWQDLLDEHNQTWEKTWDGIDIEIPSNLDLQRTARMSLFQLLANTSPSPECANSVSVGGLSSDAYGGMIFWDADTWMFPSLLAFKPKHAKNMLDYRLRMLDQAKKNARSFGLPGALFPWSSARFGNCTSAGLCTDYEYHINFDIALSLWQYFLVTGKWGWLKKKGWKVIKEVAVMFASLVRYDNTNSKYVIETVSDPDEYANGVNNSAFTNVGVKKLLGDWAPAAATLVNDKIPSNWSEIANNIEIPLNSDGDIILEYSGMFADTPIKQSSVSLISYPLNFRLADTQSLKDLEYYTPLISPSGPAMSYPIAAITSAQLAKTGCATYTHLLRSVLPNVRKPVYQFSEEISDDWTTNGGFPPAFPFITAHGAYLQIFTHGFLGMRLTPDGMTLDPMMVPQLKDGITLRGLKWRNASFDVDIGLRTTTITRTDHTSANQRAVPFTFKVRNNTYSLVSAQSVKIPTRRPDLNQAAVLGNQAQCTSVTSPMPHVPGHFPLSVVDGSNATYWQPVDFASASIMIDIGNEVVISAIHIIWGKIPARGLKIRGGNDAADREILWQADDIQVSHPYDPKDLSVRIKPGNETVVHFNESRLARWVEIIVQGSHDADANTGCTISEVIVL